MMSKDFSGCFWVASWVMKLIFALWIRALDLASWRVSVLISVAVILALGISLARVMAMMPEPVPMSQMVGVGR